MTIEVEEPSEIQNRLWQNHLKMKCVEALEVKVKTQSLSSVTEQEASQTDKTRIAFPHFSRLKVLNNRMLKKMLT